MDHALGLLKESNAYIYIITESGHSVGAMVEYGFARYIGLPYVVVAHRLCEQNSLTLMSKNHIHYYDTIEELHEILKSLNFN